jgi:hypothetical protein
LRIVLSGQLAVFIELAVFKRIPFIGGTKNGSTQWKNVLSPSHSEFAVVVKDQTFEALFDTNDLSFMGDNR